MECVSPAEAARAAHERYPVPLPQWVGFRSAGVVLVLGPEAAVRAAMQAVPQTARAVAVLQATPETPAGLCGDPPDRVVLPDLRALVLEGWLGSYHATVESGGRMLDLAALCNAGRPYDLVLDLHVVPLLTRPVLPIGYFHRPAGAGAETWEELAEWAGEFDKPRYFQYRAEICAHGPSKAAGCRACIAVCGPRAIASSGDGIRVEPHLCQGCGDCTSACPAGALDYTLPSRQDGLERLRDMLAAWYEQGGAAPVVLFHGEQDPLQNEALPEWLLPHPVEALGMVGPEWCTAALAYGARAVWLLHEAKTPSTTLANLRFQLDIAREILAGMGWEAPDFRLLPRTALQAACGSALPSRPALPRAAFAGVQDKRSAWRLAIDFFYRHAPSPPAAVSLPAGAPFGEVVVDGERCTLCMACVTACPEGALADGRDLPQLKFIEQNCVQCGLCVDRCPEDALRLSPRYLYDPSTARVHRLLHEDPVFHCVECGKPFATQRMIRTITDRLMHHPMFIDGGLRRLHLCENCRVKDQFRWL